MVEHLPAIRQGVRRQAPQAGGHPVLIGELAEDPLSGFAVADLKVLGKFDHFRN